MGENPWVIKVDEEVKQIANIKETQKKEWEQRCIYKLPSSVTDLNKNNAYKPRAVSFGPYHYGKPNLKPLEDHKHRALLHFLERYERSLQNYFDALTEDVQVLMGAYDSLDLCWLHNKDEFVQLMIRDGCFMLEILRTFTQGKNEDNGYADNDPIFSKHGKLYMMPYMKRDMLMLENQLPLMVLNKLLAVGNPEIEDEESINRLVLKFCSPQFSEDDTKRMKFGKCLHVLDVYRKSLLWEERSKTPLGHNASLFKNISTIFSGSGCGGRVNSGGGGGGGVSSSGDGADNQVIISIDSGNAGGISSGGDVGDVITTSATELQEPRIQTKKNITKILKDIISASQTCLGGGGGGGGGDNDEIIRSATELQEAGIRIKKSKTDSLKDITFQGGILRLPSIVVDDITEPMFLNLIAFERFHVGAGNDVTAYIFFMDNIIDNSKDVGLLHSCGIIQNAIGSDKAAAQLFNSLSTDVTLDPADSLNLVHKKVNNYCRRSCNQWRANLIHTYFRSPWSFLSVVAAIFLFALTIVQTIYTVGQYYQ